MKETSFFYCYDKRMLNYLIQNGFEYNCCGQHLKTKKTFWQFTITDLLKAKLLDFKGKNEFMTK